MSTKPILGPILDSFSHVDIAQAVPQIARGKVWCLVCKRMQYVDGADALRNGWPECCGETMTIDSPQWRAAHAKKLGEQS